MSRPSAHPNFQLLIDYGAQAKLGIEMRSQVQPGNEDKTRTKMSLLSRAPAAHRLLLTAHCHVLNSCGDFSKNRKPDEQVRLQEKFTHFRRLLDNNNQALETMADMEEKLSGDYVFDSSYLYSQVHNLGEQVSGMVTSLNLLTQ